MTILLVSNPASGSFDADAIARAEKTLEAMEPVTRFAASSAESFADELREASQAHDCIVVAGGDGSLSHSVNALHDRVDELTFALLPMGTGNDLATTLNLDQDVTVAAEALVDGRAVDLDLGRVSGGFGHRHFVNACVGGFSVDVDEALEEDTKKRLGRFAFWIGGLRAAADISRYRVSIDGHDFEDVVVVGVGNGRTVGGGLELWPDARPDDGVLDVCVVAAPDLSAGVRAAVQVKRAEHEGADGVTMMQGRTIEVRSAPAMEMNVDGEILGLETPLTFEVSGSYRMRVPSR